MKILITGGEGQVGRALCNKFPGKDVIALGKQTLDISNKDQVITLFLDVKPDIVFHCAAFTQVDQCEKDKKKPYEVNGIATGLIAQACEKAGAKLIYYSSDYVFNGEKNKPYIENDQTDPLSTYGMSKWIGERLVQQLSSNATIIRTSWVFGHGGKNFVNTMVNLAKQQKVIRVIDDQVGSPTYAEDLAEYSASIMLHTPGIYHVTNGGSCSWYDFAKRIYEESGYDPSLIQPISSLNYGAQTKRPKYSVLDHQKLLELGLQAPRKWEAALNEYVKKEFGND
ncbi:dTDP-4-dehydrorhamnose reductase [Bacillus hwajinpoensis]|uniref:dTDP-4-dehydrorhamnose reductase n=1 Tax=Guptibacillus hwajinpoensis TaxID=208199 RepID=A0A845EYI6_9BACL|nr:MULTISPECIES: dTDP-4-dehydrorhamnose reductase [Bacillaceae]MYL63566.1 dTDP-4-dehydrorhamnose reductase [Pseudalkalibacillus hwajinpoensis]PFG12747.1 dTDP-4-dehydrorhamnose reductase [Bacillus sp. es.036]